MIAVIHQPLFLPWIGYFNKLAHADHFVVLDNVQYNIRDYQNRAKIKHPYSKTHWLTLPVGKGVRKTKIKEVQIINRHIFDEIFDTVHHCYARTPYYNKYWPSIKHAIEVGYPSLAQVDINAIRTILSIIGLRVDVSLASELYESADATDRLIGLCKAVNCSAMIMGEVSWICHDIARITDAGIALHKQTYVNNQPTYPQVFGDFIPGLSTIDALFNVGAEVTRELVTQVWKPNLGFQKP